MVSADSVDKQLKKLGFNVKAFSNRAEQRELPNILIPDEEIFECTNGYYEGGFALLVATNIRVLLVDKKPLNFLTVEDLRFDMINQIDYSHRLLGAQISISAGSKNLKFRSYNKERLRKLINHVQHCIADVKKKQNQDVQGQNQHLEQINQQLQAYLLAQYQNQQMLNQRLQEVQVVGKSQPEAPISQVVQPSPELSDYLFAQGLLRQYDEQHPTTNQPQSDTNSISQSTQPAKESSELTPRPQPEELYAAGRHEIFSKYQARQHEIVQPDELKNSAEDLQLALPIDVQSEFTVNPLRIAYAKLPMALRIRRKLGRPQSFVQNSAITPSPTPAQT